MKTLLIITTEADLSIPLFLRHEITKIIQIDFCFFEENLEDFQQKIATSKADFIYIRDPFTSDFQEKDTKEKISLILKNPQKAHILDNIDSIEDIFLEDKFLQPQIFSKFIPQTFLLSDPHSQKILKSENFIIKKRISSRCKGILFDPSGIPKNELQDYIIQPLLHIEKEFRVYIIFREIIPQISTKRPKTPTSKAKVLETIHLSPDLKDFIEKILQKNKFDFIGLDIALSQGKYHLIEVNRSCLFNTFHKKTGINLAKVFVEKLLQKIPNPSQKMIKSK